MILEETSETWRELPQLQAFEYRAQGTKRNLLKSLCKKFKVIDLFEVSRRVRRMRDSLKSESSPDLVSQIFEAGERVSHHPPTSNWINLAQASTIYHVRIAFKSLRHAIEIVYPLLASFQPHNLRRMHD